MKPTIFTLLFLFLLTTSHAQRFQVSGNFSGKGIAFSGEESPFWMHSNQRGRVNEKSNVSGVLTGFATYQMTENARFSFGLGGLYQDGYENTLMVDESYLRFENSWIAVTAGRRQREDLYRGLSATNENILWSLNARPMPGISINTMRPIYLWREAGLAFEATLEEFLTDDDRHVPDTRVHHKSFYLLFDKIRYVEISLGLEHFVQWGGRSQDYGLLPHSFRDYINVVSGMGAGEDVAEGAEVNAVGNHLGSYVIGVKTDLGLYDLEFMYNHIIEDGSGIRLRNTPDGRYGVYLSNKDPDFWETWNWFHGVMYEFYYTKNQSKGSSTIDGEDNYFHNHVYRSGWTYNSRILGVPFIFLDENRQEVINNKLVAHHFGITGVAFNNIPFRFLASYRKNYGAKAGGQLRSDILSTYLDLTVFQNVLNVSVLMGGDFSTVDSPNFGLGVQVSRQLF